MRFLSEWLRRPDLGGVYLIGADSDIWTDPDRLDLAVLKHRHNESIFTALLSDRFIHGLHRAIFRVVSSYPAKILMGWWKELTDLTDVVVRSASSTSRPGIMASR